MNLIEKIQALIDRFRGNRGDQDDVQVIEGWMEEAKRLMLIKSLKGHAGVRYVLEIFEGEISRINETLKKTYSKDLKDIERDRLLDKRDLAERYANLFKDTDAQLDKLEETVDRENI